MPTLEPHLFWDWAAHPDHVVWAGEEQAAPLGGTHRHGLSWRTFPPPLHVPSSRDVQGTALCPPLRPQGWMQHTIPSRTVCPSSEQASLLRTALPVPRVPPTAPRRSSGGCFTLQPFGWWSRDACKEKNQVLWDAHKTPTPGVPKPFTLASSSRHNNNRGGSLKYKKQDPATGGPTGSLQVMGWAWWGCTGWDPLALVPGWWDSLCMGGFWGTAAAGPWCLRAEPGLCRGQLQRFVKDFRAALASSQSRLQREHFEILLDEENSTGSPPPEKV